MVLQYGTELLLDSVIKIILYLVLGGILGKTKETLFALLTWCVIRKQTGGRHVKNNFVCFVISGSVIFCFCYDRFCFEYYFENASYKCDYT